VNPLHRRTVLKQGHITYVNHNEATQQATFKVKAPLATYLDTTPSALVIAAPQLVEPLEVYVPYWRNTSGFKQDTQACTSMYTATASAAVKTYYLLLSEGGATESQARLTLPQGLYMTWQWQGGLDDYANLYNTKAGSANIWESQYCMGILNEFLEKLFPKTWPKYTQVSSRLLEITP